MNICFITREYNSESVDAAFSSVFNLAKEIKKQGHNVVMLSDRSKEKEHEVKEGIDIYRPYDLKLSFLNWSIAAPLGVKYLEKKLGKFDIIHTFSSAPLLAIKGILAPSKAKRVHSLKSYSRSKLGGYGWCWLFNLVDSVIVPLEIMKNKIKTNTKVNVIRTGINLERFK